MNSLQLQEIFRNVDSYVPFKPGQIVFREGDFGDIMYILMEGMVDVVVQGRVVGTFEPIEIFGEMAVIDAGPRSATVVAKTECKFVSVNQKRFIFLVQQKPQFAIHIMRMLVERIRWMDSQAGAEHSTTAATESNGTEIEQQTAPAEPQPDSAQSESVSSDSSR